MRIVQLITRPQRRGAEIFAVQLAEQLKNLGHQVWVISLLRGDGILDYSGEFIRMDLEAGAKFDLKGFKNLAKVLNKIQPDIVQSNAADTLRFGVGAKFFSEKPFKLIYRNANVISSFIKNGPQLLYNRLLHAQLDAVVSVSENSKIDYQKLFKPRAIQTIPIGIDPVEIEEKLNVDIVSKNEDYLLFVGSLVPEKDPLGMLEIFKTILKLQDGLKLKIVGSGPLESSLIERILSEDLHDSVELIPNQSNIFLLLSQAKALVMLSKIEGLPGVILEAMYCKIPVIAYGVGGIPEVLENKKTGWCIEPGDSGAFKESILEVLNAHFSEIDRIKTKAKALVLKDFQIDQIAKKFEWYYFRILSLKN